jgi:hypothetical protein
LLGRDFPFQGRPSFTRQRCVGGFDQKEALVRLYMLAVGHLKGEQSSSDLGTDRLRANAGLLTEFPAGSLFERFAVLKATARFGPEIMPRKSAGLVNKSKQQQPSERIENQQSGGWA